MKKLFILILLLFPLLTVINSCSTGEPVDPNGNQNQWPKDWYIPQEVLDYFYFKQGTFWVYENNKTGVRDSVYVISQNKGLTKATPDGERYENAGVETFSALDGYTYQYSLSMQGSAGCIKDGSKWPCYIIQCSKFKIGDVLGSSLFFIHPFQLDYGGVADGSSQSSYIKMIKFKDSISINLGVFEDISVINISNSLIANRKNTNFYWSKGNGIIMKENITDNEVWNLVNYKIVK